MNLKAVDWSLLLRKRSHFLSRFLSPRLQPEKWVFILGCYNSGTTLLHDLISTHPDVGSMPREGQFFTDQLPTGASAGLPRLWALDAGRFHWTETSDPKVDLARLKRDWAWYFKRPESKVLLEKTVLNAARSRWLQRVFPNAWFISIFRNPYAVCSGIVRKEGHEIEQAAEQWSESNRILLEDIPFLSHHIQLSYEQLTSNPSKALKDITRFLGLSEYNTRVDELEFMIHGSKSSIRNMNEDAINRLSAHDRDVIHRICSETMKRLDYD